MIFRPKKNRRRVDVAKQTGELKAAAKEHGPTVLKVIGLLVLSAGLTWGGVEGWRWATTTPTFALEDVTVRGALRASEQELATVGGLVPGLNLVALDVGAVEQGLAKHPWVKSARVTRRFPRRVEVNIIEHSPVALGSVDDQLYLLDDDGTPFKRVQAGDGVDLPLITGVDRRAFASSAAEPRAQLARALAVLFAYGASDASRGHPASEVHVSFDEVSVITADGEEIVLGDGELEKRLERLAVARRELESRKLVAAVIRLDNRVRPEWVSVTPASVVKPVTGAPHPERPSNKSPGSPEKAARAAK